MSYSVRNRCGGRQLGRRWPGHRWLDRQLPDRQLPDRGWNVGRRSGHCHLCAEVRCPRPW